MTQRSIEDRTIYKVVLNHEELCVIWPAHRENPAGWRDAGKIGTKDECLAHIECTRAALHAISGSPVSKAAIRWDQEYRAKQWDFLREVGEAPRYGAIAGYLSHYARGGRVLDLGCGEAVLLDYVSRDITHEYIGVDCSLAAIEHGRQNARRPQLHCADVDAYLPASGSLFDAIIFNEVLYYLPEPLLTLTRYGQYLSPSGVILISMYAHNRPGEDRGAAIVNRLWQALDTSPTWCALDDVVVTAVKRDLIWRLQVLRRSRD